MTEQTTTPDPAAASNYAYPDSPLPDRIVALVQDIDVGEVDRTGGCYEDVTGLLAEHDTRTDVVIANTMGLVGDWDVEDVTEAAVNALHEYRELRAQRDALSGLLRGMARRAGMWRETASILADEDTMTALREAEASASDETRGMDLRALLATPDPAPVEAAVDVPAAIRADEAQQHDALDDGWRPSPEFLRGYRAGVERSAAVAAEALATSSTDTTPGGDR